MEPRISIVIPVHDGGATAATALHSALTQSVEAVEVIVVDDGSKPWTATILEVFSSDPRVELIANPAPRGTIENYRQGLDRARADHVMFLPPTDLLEDDGCAALIEVLDRDPSVSLVLPRPDGSGDRTLSGEDAMDALFREGSVGRGLGGALCRKTLALEALDGLHSPTSDHGAEPAVLFALCLDAPSVTLMDAPVLFVDGNGEASGESEPLSADGMAKRSRGAEDALAVGRVISQRDLWGSHRGVYRGLVEHALGEVLPLFPRSVRREDRGAAFDGLADAWAAPELVSGIARWNRDDLLPFLEAAQDSTHLHPTPPDRVERLGILVPADDRDREGLMALADLCRVLGVKPKFFSEGPLELPAESGTVVTIPRWDGTGSYFERAQALAHGLAEHGVDAVVAPVDQEETRPYDLLLARLMGCGVALVVPEDPSAIFQGAGPLNLAMTLCQTATAIGIVRSRSKGFWSMASHGHVIAAEDCGTHEEFWSRILDGLENPLAPTQDPALVSAPETFDLPPVGPAASMGNAKVEALTDEVMVLRQKLAAAQDEARSLREQLVAGGQLPLVLPHVGPLFEPGSEGPGADR